jgi:hypothetical protein
MAETIIRNLKNAEELRAMLAAAPAPPIEQRRAAARALQEFRRRVGPIGIPVAELIREGRRR